MDTDNQRIMQAVTSIQPKDCDDDGADTDCLQCFLLFIIFISLIVKMAMAKTIE